MCSIKYEQQPQPCNSQVNNHTIADYFSACINQDNLSHISELTNLQSFYLQPNIQDTKLHEHVTKYQISVYFASLRERKILCPLPNTPSVDIRPIRYLHPAIASFFASSLTIILNSCNGSQKLSYKRSTALL